MRLEFTKMHGLGNDFVVLDATGKPIELSTSQIQHLADRHFGVGCDQVLLVEPARSVDTDFYYRIFNADGGEVEQCGNGARCFARFVVEKGLFEGNEISVGTARGNIRLYLEDDGQVRVNMGVPELEPEHVPFIAEQRQVVYPFDVEGETLKLGVVSMGNPHAVLISDDIDSAIERWGAAIEQHPRFPQKVNAGFLQVMNPDEARLRVYERGAGETLACGSGACAAVVAGRLQGLLDECVRVHLRGGDLIIRWQGEGQPVWMSGPAVTVFEGRIKL